MIVCVTWIVQPAYDRYVRDAEVQRRDAGSLTPLPTTRLPLEIERWLASSIACSRDSMRRSRRNGLVADAAHELRSPLTSLRLQLQLLDRLPMRKLA